MIYMFSLSNIKAYKYLNLRFVNDCKAKISVKLCLCLVLINLKYLGKYQILVLPKINVLNNIL